MKTTSPATGTVYALTDPRTPQAVRYVGQTTKPLHERHAGHLSAPAAKVSAWLDVLAAEGITPVITPLRQDVPEAELLDAETEEITRHFEAGHDLLNTMVVTGLRKAAEDERRANTPRTFWTVKLRDRNQVTLPAEALAHMGVGPGDTVGWDPLPDGAASLHRLVLVRASLVEEYERLKAAEVERLAAEEGVTNV